jgi:competence protein ComEC
MKRATKKIFLFLFFSILLIASFFISSGKKIDEPGKIIFMNVGQGDAILIQKNDLQILVDGGKGRTVLNELGKYMPFGDRKIELIILTHPDEDHMGGLLEIMNSYQVGQVMESGVACEKDICHKWDDLVAKNSIPVKSASFGQEIIMESAKISVLYPFGKLEGVEMKELNDSSLVMKVNVAGGTYLLTGDASEEVEKNLLEKNVDLKADVLKISHHGSKNSNSYEFIQSVSPKKAVISVGENSYGHPAEEVLSRLQNMNINIFRTDEAGSVAF